MAPCISVPSFRYTENLREVTILLDMRMCCWGGGGPKFSLRIRMIYRVVLLTSGGSGPQDPLASYASVSMATIYIGQSFLSHTLHIGHLV